MVWLMVKLLGLLNLPDWGGFLKFIFSLPNKQINWIGSDGLRLTQSSINNNHTETVRLLLINPYF